MNLVLLLLLSGIGLTEASCCLFERMYKAVQHEPRPAINMEKKLGWTHKLGGTASLGISRMGQTVLARLMESLMWYLLPALWGKGLEKGQWPLLTLMPDTSVPFFMPLVPFKLLPKSWSSEGVSLSR